MLTLIPHRPRDGGGFQVLFEGGNAVLQPGMAPDVLDLIWLGIDAPEARAARAWARRYWPRSRNGSRARKSNHGASRRRRLGFGIRWQPVGIVWRPSAIPERRLFYVQEDR